MEENTSYRITKLGMEVLEEQELEDVPTGDVLDAVAANRILRRMADLERAIRQVDAQEADEIERIRARAREMREGYEFRLEQLHRVYDEPLKEFAKRETDGQKQRSVNLLAGRIGFRKGRDSIEIRDEEAGLAWAKAHLKEAVVVRESLAKEIVKQYVRETGEILDWAEYRPAEDCFYIAVVE